MVVDVVEVETGISRNIFTSVVHLYDWSACDNTKNQGEDHEIWRTTKQTKLFQKAIKSQPQEHNFFLKFGKTFDQAALSLVSMTGWALNRRMSGCLSTAGCVDEPWSWASGDPSHSSDTPLCIAALYLGPGTSKLENWSSWEMVLMKVALWLDYQNQLVLNREHLIFY